MKALAILLTLGALAHGEPGKRKAAPDKFAKAASEAFIAAAAADEKGDLPTALGLYQKANAISPNPSCSYNMADVQRRLGKLPDALKSYTTYLATAPEAPDRKDVEATIEKLQRTPGTALLFTSPASDPNSVTFKDMYIFVDGELALKPGAAVPQAEKQLGMQLAVPVEMRAGKHTIDIISSLTYGTAFCWIKIGEKQPCRITAKPRIDGRVVINAPETDVKVLSEPHGKSVTKERFELPAGKTRLLVRDRQYECTPLTFDVAPGGDVTYIFLATSDYEGIERCRTFDVKKHKLHFEP